MMNRFVKELDSIFLAAGDPMNSAPMSKYMRNLFDFYGVKSPLRKEILRQYLKKNGIPKVTEIEDVVSALWSYKNREMQYVGLTLLQKTISKQPASFIGFLENLIVTKSWWDTVDFLAPLAGSLFLSHPHLQPNKTDEWISRENIWLQRSALLFQLKYRERADWDLLKTYVLKMASHEDFFIRKACGWSLRSYSKYRPDIVEEFIRSQSCLSGLTRREGLSSLRGIKKDDKKEKVIFTSDASVGIL